MTFKTIDPHSWFTAVDSSGKKLEIMNDETPEHNYPFAFEANFNNVPSPPQNTVTLYNTSKKHRDFFEKHQKCYLGFNWGLNQKIISEGYISKISTNQSDGTTESITLTFTEGTDYANVSARKLKVKKEKEVNHYKTVMVKGKRKKLIKKRVKTRATKTVMVNKAFRKGKSYKYVIKAIASLAGIKIAKIQLAKNPNIKKSFTAKGKPLNLIKQLVKTCDSRMTYVRGKLEIVDPKATKRTWYNIDDDDLISPPTRDDDTDGGGIAWQITTPLIPDVTVNVGIKLDTRWVKGKFYVSAGQHSSDGTNPQTQMTLKEAS